MPRISVPNFAGGFNQLASINAANFRSINLMPESAGERPGKKSEYLRATEGMRPFATVASLDTGAMFLDGTRLFSCTGTAFNEIFVDGTSIQRGTITYYPYWRPSIVSNGTAGNQILFTSAGTLYVYDTLTNTLTLEPTFAAAGIQVKQVEFMDGYGLALPFNSRRVYYSALEDFTSWTLGTDYFERSWASDNISFIRRAGRQLWVVGERTSEIYADNGDRNIPFAPIQGAFLDMGSISPFAGERDGESVTWLSQDERGAKMIVRANGYHPDEISTFSVERRIQAGSGDSGRAEAFVHQNEGHTCYWLKVLGLDTTMVYDFREQEWHERAIWDVSGYYATLGWQPHPARCHVYAFERHLVGVSLDGTIYEISLGLYENTLVQP